MQTSSQSLMWTEIATAPATARRTKPRLMAMTSRMTASLSKNE